MAGKKKVTDLEVIESAHALSEPHRGVIMRFKTTLTILSCLFVLSVAGCVSKVYMHPLLVMDRSIPSSEVYFFRENTLMGAALATRVYLDGKKLLQLRKSTYTKIYIRPGTYDVKVYNGDKWATVTRSMTFDTGDTYFILLAFGSNEKGMFFQPLSISEEGATSLMTEFTSVQ